MTDTSSTPRVGLSSYRVLPRIAGGSYLAAAALGRLPMSMIPLAILTLASSATGSISTGGFAAAAAALGQAIGAPAGGALADRWGQRTVLLTAVALHVTALGAFTLGIGLLPDTVSVILAALAGFTLPQVGAFSRARWLAIAPGHVPTAFAFEGVVDEIVYIFGPAFVGLIAVIADPRLAVLAAGALVAVFATWFAVHPSHRMVPRRRATRAVAGDGQARPSGSSRLRRRMLIAVAFAGMLSMGFFFAGSQTGLTAFAEQAGVPGSGALLYAAMALGSAVTTMSMVAIPASVGPWTRWCVAAAGMAGGAALMLLSDDVPLVVLSAVVAGAFQGPLLLTIFSVAGSVTELGKGGITMTFTASGTVVGLGAGAAMSGVLSDEFGSAGGFSVVLAASLLLAGLGATAAVIARGRRRREAGAEDPQAPRRRPAR
ncbi:MFS transporter [Microbacterium betulae]|uniref:MFS transporter n=1 Tax=Microbacterium betulae TaxID=2981139 RepID=A0AA97I627_9MICO|nr:MFS transporter [Microbacterium sp. AB]WOF23369.1 MFS transporter [Microbacterium sp. AB]